MMNVRPGCALDRITLFKGYRAREALSKISASDLCHKSMACETMLTVLEAQQSQRAIRFEVQRVLALPRA